MSHKLIDDGLKIFTKALAKFEKAKKQADEERDILFERKEYIVGRMVEEEAISDRAEKYIIKINNFLGE